MWQGASDLYLPPYWHEIFLSVLYYKKCKHVSYGDLLLLFVRLFRDWELCFGLLIGQYIALGVKYLWATGNCKGHFSLFSNILQNKQFIINREGKKIDSLSSQNCHYIFIDIVTENVVFFCSNVVDIMMACVVVLLIMQSVRLKLGKSLHVIYIMHVVQYSSVLMF